ncbi:zona pellucida sperm-binding protein 4-like [Myripristis murdjan]|uniref:Zona pellucida sperm-binding protein 4 n=1 Tax=Myripristis murdjan TaxID=586833 RepID=A0A667YPP2_9TELE|nr:zona pellucida sperm-binding protein 4-like [Myripristis murdjan]
MAKHWSATSSVFLALLGCLVGTLVEGQFQKPAYNPSPKGPPRPQAPEMPPPPQPPMFVPRPQAPEMPPPLPQAPKLPPPPPPQAPKLPPPPPPQAPKLPPPPPPQAPKLPPPPPPQAPKLPPPPPPQAPKLPPPPPQAPKLPPPPPQAPKLPPPPPQVPNVPRPPAAPPVQSCEVAEGQKIPCGGPDITAAACDAISCCFDGHQCYYGKAVTVQCTKDAQFIVVVARDATLPNIDLESISLLEGGQGCTHVDSNSGFAIYQFPVTACGSVVMEEPGVIIYENRMSCSYEVGVGPLGAITRDSTYELLFQCRYIGTSVETLVVEVLPIDNPPPPVAALGPIGVELRLANGQCYAKGCNEEEAAYTSFYTDADYPVTKVLRDPVYVEVQLMGKTDPNLVLNLGRCWTTTGPNPHSLPQWDLLIDGCPNPSDYYLSSLVQVGPSSGLDFPTHYKRFIFKMFTFVDAQSLAQLKEQIYIHCSTAVCTAGPGHSCAQSCRRNKRDTKAADLRKADPKTVVSSGLVIMSAPLQ